MDTSVEILLSCAPELRKLDRGFYIADLSTYTKGKGPWKLIFAEKKLKRRNKEYFIWIGSSVG